MIKTLGVASIVMVASAAACSSRAAQNTELLQPSSASVDSARQLVRAIVERNRIPGFAITVSSGRVGRPIVWHEGFGFADVDQRIPATPQTLFRIGSVSKLLTAMTLLRLEQSDRVELDQPIGSYMQTLPMHLQPLTLRHLSGHIAGIRHYRGNEFFTTTRYDRLRDAIAIFANDSLVAQPGTRYAYSSYGYNLIGAVLEEITAQPFPELVRRHVLEPLDMNATAPDMPGAHSASRARLYTVSDSGIATAPLDDLSGRWPAGGYLSSTDDLSRLGRAILADGLLNDEALRTMLTPQRLASGAATPVGVGWRVAQDSTGRRYFHHGGTSNGGAAFLLVYPDQQLVIAMASNAFTSVGERDALRIASIFLNPIP